MKTYKIHLIRHGMTDANLTGRYVGSRTDLPLCPEGVRELKDLREETEYPDIQKLYTSPMLRCRQSAAILYPGFDAQNIEEFREYDFGDFEGKTANELEIMPEYADWAAGRLKAPPNGETTEDFIKRLAVGLNKTVCDMMNEGITNSAAIMHGGAIMMLLSACAVPRKPAALWTSENGRGYSVLITPSLYHSSGVIEVYDIV